MKLDKCYLCGSDKAVVIHKGVRGGETIDVLRCANCGLVRLSETFDDADDFYKESGMRDGVCGDIEVVRRLARVDDERRYKFTEKMVENKRVLDFGCGAGGYLIRANKIASQVIGVELEENIRQQLNQEGIATVASIDGLDQFDVITLFHVLEHLTEPVGYINKFKEHLVDDGTLLVEVPNADDALLRLYTSKYFADFTYWKCHIYLYTVITLRLLAKKAGLKIKFIKHVQRYSLANHLYWLSQGKPGGHYQWSFLENPELDSAYARTLAELGMTDTIIAAFGK